MSEEALVVGSKLAKAQQLGIQVVESVRGRGWFERFYLMLPLRTGTVRGPHG